MENSDPDIQIGEAYVYCAAWRAVSCGVEVGAHLQNYTK